LRVSKSRVLEGLRNTGPRRSRLVRLLGAMEPVVFPGSASVVVTSSATGSLVDDMVTSGGHPNPARAQRVFRAVSEGTVAATLLLAGGLEALRAALLSSGLAMAVLLLVASYGILRAMHIDDRSEGEPPRRARPCCAAPDGTRRTCWPWPPRPPSGCRSPQETDPSPP